MKQKRLIFGGIMLAAIAACMAISPGTPQPPSPIVSPTTSATPVDPADQIAAYIKQQEAAARDARASFSAFAFAVYAPACDKHGGVDHAQVASRNMPFPATVVCKDRVTMTATGITFK